MMKLLSQSLTSNKNKSRNIYKSLIHILLYFQIINNQSKAINFQSISLTNLNLSSTVPASMPTPPSPISPIPSLKNLRQTTPIRTPPPPGHIGIFTPPPLQNIQQVTTTMATSKYTIGGVEYDTVAKEEIRSTSEVLYDKSFWSQLDNKGD